MEIKRRIIEPYIHSFQISKLQLVAISISARCKSKKQLGSNIGEARNQIKIEL